MTTITQDSTAVQAPAKKKSSRILAVDILRGITIAAMILVNNPGGPEEEGFAPLLHAEWIGLTPTDLIFPTFMFIMGITTYLSLRKFNFTWSLTCARKIAKRAFLLWGIGLALVWLFAFTRGMISADNADLGFFERMGVAANSFAHMRLLGVLPRLGICYGLAAIIALSVNHKFIPWLIAGIFVAYYILLELGNGYAHDTTNILDVIDKIILGEGHVYKWDSPDPEGFLSTFPALAHVLIGFCVGKVIMSLDNLNDKIERMFIIGALLIICGALLAYLCPISKKLWTPTFAMVTCGIGCTLLALLTWAIDKHHYTGAATKFFDVFGVNPLALYVLSDLLLIPISMLPLFGGHTLHQILYSNVLTAFLPVPWASVTYAILYVLLNWIVGYYLWKKKIYIKL